MRIGLAWALITICIVIFNYSLVVVEGFRFNYDFINQHRHHQYDPKQPPVPQGFQIKGGNPIVSSSSHHQNQGFKILKPISAYHHDPSSNSNSKGAYDFPPSILTFDEKYEGKQMAAEGGSKKKEGQSRGQEGKGGGGVSGESEADYILPLCCNMERDDVISFQCPNTLGTLLTPDAVFKRKTWIAPKHLVSTKRSTKFKFVSISLGCKYSSFSAKLSLNRSNGVGDKLGSPNVALSTVSQFTPDGYLKYQNEYYRPDEYCVSGLNSNAIQVRMCKVNCSDLQTPCIHKCCGLDQIYSFGYGDHPRGCVDVIDTIEDGLKKHKWFPTLYHDLDKRLSGQEIVNLNPHIIHKFPTSFKYDCRFNKTTVFPHGKGIADFLTSLTHKNFKNLEFRLRKDGWLLYPGKTNSSMTMDKSNGDGTLAKKIDNYCIDGAQDYGESSEFSNLEEETVLFLCSGGVDEAFETKSIPSSTSSSPSSYLSHRSSDKEGPPAVETPTSTPESYSQMTELLKAFEKLGGELQDFQNFKNYDVNRSPIMTMNDEISVTMGDTSSSVEIEIDNDSASSASSTEQHVLENSLETDNFFDNGDGKSKLEEPAPFIPAVLKIAVQVPQQTSKIYPIPQPVNILPSKGIATVKKKIVSQTSFVVNNNFIGDGQSVTVQRSPRHTIPTCCTFAQDVNDGFTHHCRNRRMADKLKALNGTESTTDDRHGDGTGTLWNVPNHFMTRDNTPASFSLKSAPLTCGQGRFQFQGFIHNFEQERAKSSGDKKHGILSDGWLKYDNEFYSPEQYCVNGLSPRIVEVLVCKPDCSMWETPCLQKCCGLDEIYNLGLGSGNRGCQPLRQGEKKFLPKLYKDLKSPPVDAQELKDIQPHFVQKYPPSFQETCFNKITLAFPFSKEVAEKLTPAESAERGATGFKHLNFRFRKDGKLMYSYPEADGIDVVTESAVYDRGEYCVDGVRDFGENELFANHENQTILFICASEPHSMER